MRRKVEKQSGGARLPDEKRSHGAQIRYGATWVRGRNDMPTVWGQNEDVEHVLIDCPLIPSSKRLSHVETAAYLYGNCREMEKAAIIYSWFVSRAQALDNEDQ